MNKENIEEGLKSIFGAMAASSRKETNALVQNALEKLKQSGMDYTNPERFGKSLMNKIQQGVREIAKTMHPSPISGIDDNNKPNFIYVNYSFLENHITELCVLREGTGCSVDKSRFILNMYLKYSLTGNIPEFNPEEEHYYYPNFGSYIQWIEFCDALYGLYYGNPEKYFTAYNTLLQQEQRLYKHICHLWYIKFTDGQSVKFDNTWDERMDNPLDNEFYDKGDYYVLSDAYTNNRNYEKYEDEDSIRDDYVKVPKTDVIEIYKVSEEKMQ